jgi:ABC-type sugar transport system ATPase subunit
VCDPTRLYPILPQDNKLQEGDDGLVSVSAIGKLPVASVLYSFRSKVSLRYPEQTKAALDDISFDIQPGQLVIVVGANGSGKSSMLKLLPRLFDPTCGEILIDGISLTAYDTDDLRRYMAVLPQDQSIYPLSLRENIEFGLISRQNLGQDKVATAARLGGSFEFIQALPQGFETNLSMIQTGWNAAWNGITPGAVSETIMRDAARRIGKRVSITGMRFLSLVNRRGS